MAAVPALGVGEMNLNLVNVTVFAVGGILVYAAVKNVKPQDVVKSALGTPLAASSAGSGTTTPSSAAGATTTVPARSYSVPLTMPRHPVVSV